MAIVGEPMPLKYDEKKLMKVLTELSVNSRLIFACACAERLMLTLDWYWNKVGANHFGVVRSALDSGWASTQSQESSTEKLDSLVEQVKTLVPNDDDEALFPGLAVAQNAVASVAYALGTWLQDDSQQAVWAARQLYDAADVIVQQGAAVQTYIERVDEEEPVQMLLRGMCSDLRDLQSGDESQIPDRAKADGRAFLAYLTE